jgi:hypothetical protein
VMEMGGCFSDSKNRPINFFLLLSKAPEIAESLWRHRMAFYKSLFTYLLTTTKLTQILCKTFMSMKGWDQRRKFYVYACHKYRSMA